MSKCIQISGKQASLYIKEEAEFAKNYTDGFYKVPFNSLSLSESQNPVKDEEISFGNEPSRPGKGNIELAGSAEMYMRSIAIYPWLKTLFGEVKTVADGAKFSHEFTNTDGCSDSLQLDVQYKGEGIGYKNKGIKMNSMSFNLVEEGNAKASMDLIGSRQKLIKILPDSFEVEVEVDANINTKTIDIVDDVNFAKLSKGDTIVIPYDGGTVQETYTNVKSIKLDAGHTISRFDNVLIDGVEYDVISVAGDLISLGSQIDVIAGATVVVLNNVHKIESIDVANSTITLETGIKKALVDGDKIKVGISESEKLLGKKFSQFDAQITSGDSRLVSKVQSFSVNINKAKEGMRDLNSRGAVSSISDGDIEIPVEIGLLFSYENAHLINDAKNGLVTDLKVTLSNEDGDRLEFIFPQGDLTASTPETTPGGMTSTVTFTPFAEDGSPMIIVKLINSKEVY